MKSWFQRNSSGPLGCPPHQIAIKDQAGATYSAISWTATCNGKVYYCSGGGKDNTATKCSPADKGGGSAAASAAPSAAPAK